MIRKPRSIYLLATALTTGMGVMVPGQAMAQAAPTGGQARTYAIPAQGLPGALRQFAEQSGLQLVYDAGITTDKSAPAVNGTMSAQDALTQLLAGTGLGFQFSANGSVIIAAGASDGVRSLGIVRVEGAGGTGNGKATPTNGVNGSRDVEATEGTGSYTSGALSIGTKTPESIKDTPMSVSVLTTQNIRDQNLTTLKDGLNELAGITLTQATSSNGNTLAGLTNDQFHIFSRGFEITTFQIDGGAPLGQIGGSLYQPIIDLADYDSVQLLRGASGLFNGYGDPGGTINLMRKKPLDHNQISFDAQLRSYNDYRGVADITGPIAFGGKLRARMVATYEDNDYYYEVAHNSKISLYGIVEMDVTPTTLVSGGVNYYDQHGVPNAYGLPRYSDGSSLNLPVATCLCFTWNRQSLKSTDIFAQVDQKIGKDWSITVKATHGRQTSDGKYGYNEGTGSGVNPITLANANAQFQQFAAVTRQWVVDGALNGAFQLFGQRQEIVAGANYQFSDSGGTKGYGAYTLGALNPLTFNPFDTSNPLNTEPASHPPSVLFDQLGGSQWGAYLNVRLTPFSWLHLVSGVRYTRYNSTVNLLEVCADVGFGCAADGIGQPPTYYALFGISPRIFSKSTGHNLSKPNLSAIVDVTKQLSAYGTYASIYKPQTQELTTDLTALPPIRGRNVEAGLKWQSANHTVNANLALYSIIQTGFGLAADTNTPANGLSVPVGFFCCFVPNSPQRFVSKGLDFELIGKIVDGLQISASYTYNQSKNEGVPIQPGSQEQPIQTLVPKHSIKVFGTYNFQTDQWYRRVTLGAGINYQSTAYSYGDRCILATTTNELGQPVINCAVPRVIQFFHYEIPPYAVVQASMRYKLSDHAEFAVNLNNLTNSHSFQTVSSYLGSGNFYIEPRTATLSLRAKW